jgi:hypothetical protein
VVNCLLIDICVEMLTSTDRSVRARMSIINMRIKSTGDIKRFMRLAIAAARNPIPGI